MSNNFAEAYERLLSVYGIRTQMELAERLGIRQSSISDAKRRAVIPAAWLVTALIDTSTNPEWIRTGEGSTYLVPAARPMYLVEDIKRASDAELLGELALRLKTYGRLGRKPEALEQTP